jgi:hypothetical protein
MRRYILAVIAVLVVAAGACGGGGCNKRKTAEFLAAFEPIIEDWDDTNELAGSTSRIALSPVIERMQSLKRQVSDLESPCEDAEALQAAAIEYMELTIDAYLLFATQKPDEDVSAKMREASTALNKVARLWSELQRVIE